MVVLVGVQAPAVLLASFVPMFFIAAAFYYRNRADQDCGTPPELAALSGRELEVMRHVARGRSNAEIAVDLVLAETTVKTHVASVLHKLGARDRVQLVIRAYESGLVGPSA